MFRACLKNHSCNLHAPFCGTFVPNSVVVARYDALIRDKFPTNCDAHLAESIFQTRSGSQGLERGDTLFFSIYFSQEIADCPCNTHASSNSQSKEKGIPPISESLQGISFHNAAHTIV